MNINIQIQDLEPSDLSLIQELLAKRSSRGEKAEAEVGGGSQLAIEGLLSVEAREQRKLFELLTAFKDREWKVPKGELSDLNERVFSKEGLRKASVLYAKRSGYFTLDKKSNVYIATDKAKGEFERLRASLLAKGAFQLAQTVGDSHDPKYLKNPLVSAAAKTQAFFSDLSDEGIEKLTKSLNQQDQEQAIDWIWAAIDNLMDMCGNLNDVFGVIDNVRSCLDMMVESLVASEEFRSKAPLEN